MINNIYSDQILKHASQVTLQQRLDSPHATASKRSDFCGSKITIDIDVKNGEITAFGQDIDACALGCAAASIVAEYIIGASVDEVLQTQIQTWEMLTNNGDAPTGRFANLKILQSVAQFPNRHASTMLTLDALVAAIKDIE